MDFWKESGENVERRHSDLIFKPIDPHNTQKWKKAYSDEQVQKYEFFSRCFLKKYGYDIKTKKRTIAEIIHNILEIAVFLPKRMFHIIHISFYMKFAQYFGLSVKQNYYD